jgi:hypothetical protein
MVCTTQELTQPTAGSASGYRYKQRCFLVARSFNGLVLATALMAMTGC